MRLKKRMIGGVETSVLSEEICLSLGGHVSDSASVVGWSFGRMNDERRLCGRVRIPQN